MAITTASFNKIVKGLKAGSTLVTAREAVKVARQELKANGIVTLEQAIEVLSESAPLSDAYITVLTSWFKPELTEDEKKAKKDKDALDAITKVASYNIAIMIDYLGANGWKVERA